MWHLTKDDQCQQPKRYDSNPKWKLSVTERTTNEDDCEKRSHQCCAGCPAPPCLHRASPLCRFYASAPCITTRRCALVSATRNAQSRNHHSSDSATVIQEGGLIASPTLAFTASCESYACVVRIATKDPASRNYTTCSKTEKPACHSTYSNHTRGNGTAS